jgi:hypothetical protein
MTVGPVSRDEATADFFDAAAAGQFLLRHCRACDALSTPQAAQCEQCASTALDWRPATGDATLVSWTVTHGKPDQAGHTARTILAIAELAEGPWWWSQLTNADPAELRVGTPLRIHFLRPAPHPEDHPEAEAVPVFALR